MRYGGGRDRLFQTVANDALVNGITPSAIPSYVPAGNFAKALIDALRGGAGPSLPDGRQ